MKTVFITGATGYIGFQVAQAFRRKGYQVWGLTRSEAKGKTLAQHEIYPVIGQMQETSTFAATVAQADVLVHAAVDYQNGTADLDTQTVQALIDTAKPEAILLYTSGAWVYGNTKGVVTEDAPTSAAKAVAWRPAVEQIVLRSESVKGIVVRPGVVYGKQGGLTGLWFGGGVEIVGDGTNHWAMVHVDDLAQGYVLAAESGLVGQVFNLVDGSTATVMNMATAVAQATGRDDGIKRIPVLEAVDKFGDMAEALSLDQRIVNEKAQRLLGWRPIHTSFADDIKTYFAAWKASNEAGERSRT